MVIVMKKILNYIGEWITGACYMFSASVILCLITSMIMNSPTIAISNILSLLVISAIGTLIQYIAFTDRVIKNVKYAWRLIIFVVPFGVILTAIAVLFDWFPTEIPGAWMTFSGIFILVFVIMTFSFEIYFRITGKKYDGLLGQYKKKKEQENGDK